MTEKKTKEKNFRSTLCGERPNCSNTLIKFFNEDEQFVKNLNFYDPNIYEHLTNNKEICQKTSYKLFNIKKIGNNKGLNASATSKGSKNQSNNAASVLVLPRIDLQKKKQLDNQENKENSIGNLSQRVNNPVKEEKNNMSINELLNYKFKSSESNDKNLTRAENMNKESKLESRRKILLDKLREAKNEHLELIQLLNLNQKEIESLKAEIEVLENYNKFVDGLGGASNLKKVELLRSIKRQNTDSKEVLFFAASQLQKEVIQRDKDLQGLRLEIDDKKVLREEIKIRAQEVKDEIKKYKEEIEAIRNKLMLHYHTLLNEGNDTRQEGLVWLIKAIWNLGHNVIMSYMPNYLDEKSIDFFFSIAHKDYELQKMRNEIEDIKRKLKGNIGEDRKSVIKRGKTKSSASVINLRDSVDLNNEKDKYNIHKIEEKFNCKKNIDQETYILMSKIAEYEKTYEFYKAEIHNQKINELNRINKEFLTNDYHRRYGVNQQVLVSAICGEDNMSHEYSRIMREQKVYFDKIKMCQSYSQIGNKIKI